LGILHGGVAADAIGIRVTVLLSGLVSGLIGVIVLFEPGVRDVEKEP
jgi:hypothetical protein